MQRDRAGLCDQRYRLVDLARDAVRIDRAGEHPAVVMVVDRPEVRARHDHHRPVVGNEVVEQDAHGQHIVVGVGVEGPVLMPLDRSAIRGGLQVELGGVHPHRRPQQRCQQGQHLGAADQIGEGRVVLVRQLQPAHPGLIWCVGVFQVVEGGVVSQALSPCQELVRGGAQAVKLLCSQHVMHDEIALLTIEINLLR